MLIRRFFFACHTSWRTLRVAEHACPFVVALASVHGFESGRHETVGFIA